MSFEVKRVYDEPADSDGYRVLVDRLWPRGLSKEKAALDEWFKEIAPSSNLRTWFGHDPEKFAEFSRRYRAELLHNDEVEDLRKLGEEHATVTLLYSAHDTEHNQAVVLRRFLESA